MRQSRMSRAASMLACDGDRMDQAEAITTAARALASRSYCGASTSTATRVRATSSPRRCCRSRAPWPGRYANRGEPLDDLVQVACIGIMKAIDGFDLDARGALLLLRDADGPRRDQAPLPRQDVGDARPARPAGAPARGGQGARQADQRARPLADRAGDRHRRRGALRGGPGDASRASARAARARSTSRPARTSRSPTRWAPSTPSSSAPRCAPCSTAPSTCSPSATRRCCACASREDLTQTEIAERIGVSQMQVSRLIRQSLARLRMDIERSPERSVADRLAALGFAARDAAGLQTGSSGSSVPSTTRSAQL